MPNSHAHLRFLKLLLLLTTGPLSLSAHAQIVIPPGVEPGQIQRDLNTQRTSPATTAALPPPIPERTSAPEVATLSFQLRSVMIEGATVYRSDDLLKPYTALLDHDVTVAQLFTLANELTARYRRDGYVLSQVLVPAQDIQEGRVKLIAVEGYVSAVQFRGDATENDKLLSSYANKLTAQRPLTAAMLERTLLLMNDLGATTARGTLIPAAQVPGAADLIVDITHRRVLGELSAHNRSSRSLGAKRYGLGIELHGLLSNWDQLELKGGSSGDRALNFAQFGYGASLGNRGARWHVEVTGVRAHPKIAANLSVTDLTTESVAGEFAVSFPLLRSRTRNVYLNLKATSFDGQSQFLLADLSNDRIRALRLGVTFDVADHWLGVSTFDLEYSHGLDGIGARKQASAESPLSRDNARADFSKVTAYASRLQSLGHSWSLLTAVSAQQAYTVLLAPELFAFGGETFGRGYDAAEIAADSGQAAKLELRYAGFAPQLGLPAYTMYAFADWGQGQRRNPINEAKRETASSAGLGMRFTGPGSRWHGMLELASPLDHVVAAEGNRRPRWFLGVQTSL